jgi:phosphatidylglycerophosphatase A
MTEANSSTSCHGRQRVAWLVSTTFGLGEVVPAPGTLAGSLPAAVCWAVLAWLAPELTTLVIATLCLSVLATCAGLWAAGVESKRRGVIDPGPVVIDEVAGQWITFLIALLITGIVDGLGLVVFIAAGFFLFRVADVVKPWPICRLEKLPGAIGIVADDVAAGVLAGVVLGTGWILAFQ